MTLSFTRVEIKRDEQAMKTQPSPEIDNLVDLPVDIAGIIGGQVYDPGI